MNLKMNLRRLHGRLRPRSLLDLIHAQAAHCLTGEPHVFGPEAARAKLGLVELFEQLLGSVQAQGRSLHPPFENLIP